MKSTEPKSQIFAQIFLTWHSLGKSKPLLNCFTLFDQLDPVFKPKLQRVTFAQALHRLFSFFQNCEFFAHICKWHKSVLQHYLTSVLIDLLTEFSKFPQKVNFALQFLKKSKFAFKDRMLHLCFCHFCVFLHNFKTFLFQVLSQNGIWFEKELSISISSWNLKVIF